ncbi:MAG: transcriptional repressor [Candidatus Krumholzibacteria bacterium]|nr:transcriptional repressor [Candidatus Krumholzibacteria bacterium]
MIKRSRPKDEILRILSVPDHHPTTEEIFAEVKSLLPDTGIATVYRNLEKLTSSGMIIKLERGSGSSRYDGNLVKHDHCVCKICGKTSDVWLNHGLGDKDLSDVVPGFEVSDYTLEFFGVCGECAKRKKN